mmetsp:Transcript_43660/g.170858  ORF Transcript_43660/g.170858 Transcript_43660/m.170858 type:complete len:215 (+) Transcript_43660:163-807(+)
MQSVDALVVLLRYTRTILKHLLNLSIHVWQSCRVGQALCQFSFFVEDQASIEVPLWLSGSSINTQFEDLVCARALNGTLFHDHYLAPVLIRDKLLDLVGGSGLLGAKLVARKGNNLNLVIVLLRQVLHHTVHLFGVSTKAGDVHRQNWLSFHRREVNRISVDVIHFDLMKGRCHLWSSSRVGPSHLELNSWSSGNAKNRRPVGAHKPQPRPTLR